MDVASLTVRVVNEGLDKANRGLDLLSGKGYKAQKSVDSVNESAKRLDRTMGLLKGALGGVFAGVGIQSLLRTADTMQSLDSQVRLVTDSVAQFNAVQDRLGKIANNQYADIEALTTLYTRSQRALSQLGKSQNEVLQFTENVSMAMRVGGVSAQEQAAALLQLSQALGSGVLRGDEFNSIAEQAPILLRLVSEEMGVTQGALRALAADGKITSEIVYNAVANATESLTEMAAQMPITVSQALTVLSSNYKRFVGDFINSTTGLSSIVAGAIGVIAQNFDTLSTILMAGAAVWAYYALASSSFVVSTIPALVLGIQTSIMGFVAQTAAIQAAITAQGAAIASTLSLASMQGYLATTTYALQQARVVATLALLNYKLALFEAAAATQAKIASTAGAIAVQAQYAYSVATSGNLLAIFSLAVQGAAANLVAKVSATVAAARANAIYAASMVTTHGVVGATALGIRALTGAIIAKTGAMIAAIRQTSAYSLAMGGLGLAARGATTAISGVAAMFGRLAAVLLAHPIMALAGAVFAVTASTRGMKGAIDDVTDAFKVLGYVAVDIIQGIIGWVKDVWSLTTSWFKGLMGGGNAATDFLGEVFGGWFANTEGGFVGLLQVIGRVFDSVVRVIAAAVATIAKGVYNLYVRISNLAAGMGNSLVDAFNWAARGITSVLNSIGRGINEKIDALNSLPLVNIKARATVDWQPVQGDRFATKSLVDNSFSANMDWAAGALYNLSLENSINKGIAKVAQAKQSADDLAAGLNQANEAFEALGGTAEKAGAKGKKATDKMAKGAKGAAEKLSDAQKAAQALNDAFLKAQQGLQRTLNLIGQETNLAQWIYDLSDPLHELYRLSDNGKDVLKELAASIDISELSYELGKSNKDLEHQIRLLDVKSDLERELMGIERETGQLLEKYEIYKNTPGFEHVYKEIEAETQLNEQLKKNLATKSAIVAINKELEDATADLNKQIFLFGNDSPIAALNYDLEFTEKYAHASESAIRELYDALLDLEKLKSGKAFNDIVNDMAGISGNPVQEAMNEYNERLKAFAAYAEANYELLENSLEAQIQLEKMYMIARADMYAKSGEAIFGSMSSIMKDALGEQSGVYRAMFAIEKGFAIAKSVLAIQTALASAQASLPFPANLPVIASVATQGANIISAIKSVVPKGFKQGGYTGSIGANNIAGVVHGNEYVFDAQSTKAIGVENLERIRRGKGTGEVNITVNNHSSAKVETETDSQGNIIMTIRDEVKRSWSNLQNPNSHESKMLGRNVQAPRRR